MSDSKEQSQSAHNRTQPVVAVVIPCYRVIKHIAGVISAIGPEVGLIYCVDDACPENSGDFIQETIKDPRVILVRNPVNLGVGGAVLNGYSRAIADGATVIVKIDGDGQMDPGLLPDFIAPILHGECDYTKGNRFWDLRQIRQMPLLRRVGNLGLSFISKASTGYWDIFDPTNGYTAIHASVASRLPVESISRRYFFETDILFRLNTMRAVVVDIPMDAKYGDEVSGLKVSRIFSEFAAKHALNFAKRIVYNYFLRDLSIASIELLFGSTLCTFGAVFGAYHWIHSAAQGVATPVGTIMISTISIVSGIQLLLAFLGFDIASVPKRPLSPVMMRRGVLRKKVNGDEGS